MAGLYESKKLMTRLYQHERMSPEDIAKKMNVSHMTIYRWLRKHGLMK